MPIVLNPAAENPYDIAQLVSQITARNQQARQAAGQIEAGAYKGLADDIGGAAKNYTHAKLTQQQQEMQDRRERDARQERRALHDESQLLSATQYGLSAQQKIDDDLAAAEKEGREMNPEVATAYKDWQGRFSKALMTGQGTPSQNVSAINQLVAEGQKFRANQLKKQEELPPLGVGRSWVRKPGTNQYEILDNRDELKRAEEGERYWDGQANNDNLSPAAKAAARVKANRYGADADSFRGQGSKTSPTPSPQGPKHLDPLPEQEFGDAGSYRLGDYGAMAGDEMPLDDAALAEPTSQEPPLSNVSPKRQAQYSKEHFDLAEKWRKAGMSKYEIRQGLLEHDKAYPDVPSLVGEDRPPVFTPIEKPTPELVKEATGIVNKRTDKNGYPLTSSQRVAQIEAEALTLMEVANSLEKAKHEREMAAYNERTLPPGWMVRSATQPFLSPTPQRGETMPDETRIQAPPLVIGESQTQPPQASPSQPELTPAILDIYHKQFLDKEKLIQAQNAKRAKPWSDEEVRQKALESLNETNRLFGRPLMPMPSSTQTTPQVSPKEYESALATKLRLDARQRSAETSYNPFVLDMTKEEFEELAKAEATIKRHEASTQAQQSPAPPGVTPQPSGRPILQETPSAPGPTIQPLSGNVPSELGSLPTFDRFGRGQPGQTRNYLEPIAETKAAAERRTQERAPFIRGAMGYLSTPGFVQQARTEDKPAPMDSMNFGDMNDSQKRTSYKQYLEARAVARLGGDGTRPPTISVTSKTAKEDVESLPDGSRFVVILADGTRITKIKGSK